MPTNTTYTPPPFDPEVGPALSLETALPPSADLETLISRRGTAPIPARARRYGGTPHRTRGPVDPWTGGSTGPHYQRVEERGHQAGGPGFYWIHAGGMVTGDRFASMPMVMEWVEATASTEWPYPSTTGWLQKTPTRRRWRTATRACAGWPNAARSSDTTPTSCSAAAAAAVGAWLPGLYSYHRTRRAPAVFAQMLIWPMIDDRNDTFSAHQMEGVGIWDLHANKDGWTALLGDRRGTDAVSI